MGRFINIFLFLCLLGMPVFAEDSEITGFFVGVNGSAGGSAEGAGFAFEMGTQYENAGREDGLFQKHLLVFDFGVILNEEQKNYEASPSTAALLNAVENAG